MTTFQNVALIGKGSLGSLILTELLKANYTVTVLTRSDPATSPPLPPNTTLKQVDYTSISSLTFALEGHDIAISTIAPSAIPLQKPIIDAAIAAGVKRFIPAEYAAMASDPSEKGQSLPFHAPVIEIRKYLKKREGEIEHTIFAVGGFLEMIFSMPLVVDFPGRRVTFYDEGKHRFSVSRISTVAKAVVASLGKADETRNRVVRVQDAVLTQRKVYDLVQKWTPGEEWTETHVNAEEQLNGILETLQKGFDPELIPGLFVAAFLGGRFGAEYDVSNLDNGLLGVEGMSEEEVERFGYQLVSGSEGYSVSV
ncbi:hypothetical protein BJX70DRAFT_394586 [Aspergillus crustosus]